MFPETPSTATSYGAGHARHRHRRTCPDPPPHRNRSERYLLAWWNAGSCGGFDLTDLWMVDRKIADDMLATAAFVATHHEYPNSYGLRADFETLIALWRPQLLQKTS